MVGSKDFWFGWSAGFVGCFIAMLISGCTVAYPSYNFEELQQVCREDPSSIPEVHCEDYLP